VEAGIRSYDERMPERIVGRVLRLVGYDASRCELDEAASKLTIWVEPTGRSPTFTCSGCLVERSAVHSSRERRVRDLPWGTWSVELVLDVHRVRCPRCGVRTERVPFLEGKHPYTKRYAEAVAADCNDAAVRRVARKWKLSPQTVQRIDKRAMASWAQSRKRQPVRHLGVDELYWAKGRCLTIVSDLDRGEPIWAGLDRRKETLDRFFHEAFPVRRRRAVKAVCVDMYEPFALSLREHLPGAAIVYDKFHVMQHVAAAVDETRRREFFRHKGPRREAMKGKRWLLLTRWSHLDRDGRQRLNDALRLNRRLFKAYYLKEEIDRLWDYSSPAAALRFFDAWRRRLRWQRLPAFKKLARTIERHLEGILNHCWHKVPFGVVEAINGNLRALIRRGRGYRDHEYLVLKAQHATAQARLSRLPKAA
jgi:transposase